MPRKKRVIPRRSKHVSLLLVEGETETEFYSVLSKLMFNSTSKRIKNLHGNFNINKKILDAAKQFSRNNPHHTFDIYICIDQEKPNIPTYDKSFVLNELTKNSNFRKVHDVIANLMIESLFFIDIDNIYKFLRARKIQRKPAKYSNFRSLRHQDLSILFKQFGKTYYKGIKCEGLISSLDLKKITSKASELSNLVAEITKDNN